MESAATKNYVLLFLLAVLILSVFLQTAKHEFIHFDVSEYLTQNNIVQRGLTREGLVWAFTTLKTGDWQPLTWISWMLDVHFFGVNARASHLINVLFHLLNALFFFALIQKMTGKTGRSFFAAALYAMHPLRAESVVWVAERKDVLSTFFLFLTCFQYLHYSRSVGRRFLSYGLILIWFALGLMAKPMLVTLPFALLLFDYWPLAQLKTKADFISKVVEKIPMLLLSLGSCWMTLRAAVYSGVLADPEVLPWSVRLCNAFVSYLQYLVKLFYPVGLSYFYPYRGYDLSNGEIICGITVVVTGSYLAWKLRSRKPYGFTGWFWFLGTLVPVIGVLQGGQQSMADRYTYVPHLMLWVAVIWGAYDFIKAFRLPSWIASSAGILGILVTGVLGFRQVAVWKTPFTLTEHALRVTKSNHVANLSLAYAYSEIGDYEKGIHYAMEALKIKPQSPRALNYLSFHLAQRGHLDMAVFYLQKALIYRQGDYKILMNLALLYFLQGKVEPALDILNGLLISPKVPPRAVLLMKQRVLITAGRYDEALAVALQAIERFPEDPDFRYAAGHIHYLKNDLTAAVTELNNAVRIYPKHISALHDLGMIYFRQRDFLSAKKYLESALTMDSSHPVILRNLGRVLFEMGDYEKAENCFYLALKEKHDYALAYRSWGRLYMKQRKWREAEFLFRKALEINANMPVTHKLLGDTLKALGNGGEAAQHYREAVRLRKIRKFPVDMMAYSGQTRNPLSIDYERILPQQKVLPSTQTVL